MAAAGNADACIELAQRYTFGEGLPAARPDSALHYLGKAAAHGSADAAYLAAIHHLRGLGTPKSEPKGLALLAQAADGAHTDAVRALVELYSAQPLMALPMQVQVAQNLPLALEYARKGAQMGDVAAAYYAAEAYFAGKGTPRNDSLALAYMHLAADSLKDPRAQATLGRWYFRGLLQGGSQLALAHAQYQQLAENPHADHSQQTTGRVGMHECVQWARRSLNLQWVWAYPDPRMAPQLFVKP